MKRILILTSCLLLAGYALAQQSPPSLAVYPDVNTPETNAGIALMSYKSVVEANIATTFQLEQNDAQAIASLNAQIVALQAQLNTQAATQAAQASQMTAMQAQINQLLGSTGPPAPSTSVNWSTFPDGPINGVQGPINYGTGWWCVVGGELKACANGQGNRAVTFATPVTVTSVTFSTTTAVTTTIKLTSAAGQVATSIAAGLNQDSTFTPGWATPTLSFTMTSMDGNATDLRIRSLSWH